MLFNDEQWDNDYATKLSKSRRFYGERLRSFNWPDFAGSRESRDLQARVNNFKHLPPEIRALSERAAPSRKVCRPSFIYQIFEGGCSQFPFFFTVG
jgi:hypothetical protein